MKRLRDTLLITAILLATIVPLSLHAEGQAPDGPKEPAVRSEIEVSAPGPDVELARTVAAGLFRSVHVSIFDRIDVESRDGVVTLHGKVTMGYKAEALAELALRTPGVREVRNLLTTFPASTTDDDLRNRIAGRLYRSPLLTKYAVQANPPIHIAVERGRVTLLGVVDTPSERLVAETLARNVLGVLSVENLIEVEQKGSS